MSLGCSTGASKAGDVGNGSSCCRSGILVGRGLPEVVNCGYEESLKLDFLFPHIPCHFEPVSLELCHDPFDGASLLHLFRESRLRGPLPSFLENVLVVVEVDLTPSTRIWNRGPEDDRTSPPLV